MIHHHTPSGLTWSLRVGGRLTDLDRDGPAYVGDTDFLTTPHVIRFPATHPTAMTLTLASATTGLSFVVSLDSLNEANGDYVHAVAAGAYETTLVSGGSVTWPRVGPTVRLTIAPSGDGFAHFDLVKAA